MTASCSKCAEDIGRRRIRVQLPMLPPLPMLLMLLLLLQLLSTAKINNVERHGEGTMIGGSVAAVPITSLIAPVSLDGASSLYTLRLAKPSPTGDSPILLELDSSNLWRDCVNPRPYTSPSLRPLPCSDAAGCAAAASCTAFICGSAGCYDDNCYTGSGYPYPACSNYTCASWASVTGAGTLGTSVWRDSVSLLVRDPAGAAGAGAPRRTATMTDFSFLCADDTLLASGRIALPPGLVGGTGLSRAPIALPSQISAKIPTVARKFSYCLPSAAAGGRPGPLLFGDGPFFHPSGRSGNRQLELSALLNFVRLRTFSRQKDAYFLDIRSISVDGVRLPIPPSVFSIEKNRTGRSTSYVGGSRITTGNRYTLLAPRVYDALAARFAAAAAARGIRPAPPVAPFLHCFDASSARPSPLGPDVPAIDLAFKKRVSWRISGANSVVPVGRSLCLAFQKTDDYYEYRSVLLGTFQQQDGFFHFDLVANRLGFIPTLLAFNTTCSAFRFDY